MEVARRESIINWLRKSAEQDFKSDRVYCILYYITLLYDN